MRLIPSQGRSSTATVALASVVDASFSSQIAIGTFIVVAKENVIEEEEERKDNKHKGNG